jgi:hypothetical protein
MKNIVFKITENYIENLPLFITKFSTFEYSTKKSECYEIPSN